MHFRVATQPGCPPAWAQPTRPIVSAAGGGCLGRGLSLGSGSIGGSLERSVAARKSFLLAARDNFAEKSAPEDEAVPLA